jgi:hypothetical protein
MCTTDLHEVRSDAAALAALVAALAGAVGFVAPLEVELVGALLVADR